MLKNEEIIDRHNKLKMPKFFCILIFRYFNGGIKFSNKKKNKIKISNTNKFTIVCKNVEICIALVFSTPFCQNEQNKKIK